MEKRAQLWELGSRVETLIDGGNPVMCWDGSAQGRAFGVNGNAEAKRKLHGAREERQAGGDFFSPLRVPE